MMNEPQFKELDTFSNLDAEYAVLGALMLKNDLIDDLASLKAEHFSDSANQLIYKVICKQISNGKVSDCLTIFDALSTANRLGEVGGMPYLNTIATSVSSTYGTKRHAEIIIDKAKLRMVREKAQSLNEAITHKGLTGDEAIAEAGRVLASIDEQQDDEHVFDASDLAQDVIKDVQDRFDGVSDDVVKTGFDCLDNDVLPNGLTRGQLVVIAGRTSMGKTAFVTSLALNASVESKVLMVSYEMSKRQMSRRCIAALGEMPLSSLQKGFRDDDVATWDKLTTATDKLNSLMFSIAERCNPTAYGVGAIARKHKRKNGLDLLIVDHLGLMQHEQGKNTNTATAIGDTTRILKQIAQDLDVVVVLLVQVNREGGKGEASRPTVRDLRDSGRIEEDADVVMLLHRDDYYRDEEKKTTDGHTHLICAKVRDGDPKTVNLKFHGAYSKFTDWHGELPERPAYKATAQTKTFGKSHKDRYAQVGF